MREPTDGELKRFWDKVDRRDDNLCWEWQSAKRRGYGVFSIDNTTTNAHRVAYAAEHGEWPDGYACHICDNKSCCNPNHLYDGTPKQNAQDYHDRQREPGKFEGDSNPNAKLTEEDVKEIKRRLGSDTQASLAEEFGVNHPAISHIATGRTWSDVEP